MSPSLSSFLWSIRPFLLALQGTTTTTIVGSGVPSRHYSSCVPFERELQASLLYPLVRTHGRLSLILLAVSGRHLHAGTVRDGWVEVVPIYKVVLLARPVMPEVVAIPSMFLCRFNTSYSLVVMLHRPQPDTHRDVSWRLLHHACLYCFTVLLHRMLPYCLIRPCGHHVSVTQVIVPRSSALGRCSCRTSSIHATKCSQCLRANSEENRGICHEGHRSLSFPLE